MSELLGRRVLASAGDELARLTDMAALPREQFPAVQWAFLSTRNGELVVRWSNMGTEPGHFRLLVPLSDLLPASLPDDALRLSRDLMDRQIVDTHGAKIVRVNDLWLEESSGQLRVMGVDVGLRGLFRRLGVERPAGWLLGLFGKRLPRGMIPWHLVEPIEVSSTSVRLTVPHAKLALMHPADIADIVEEMTVSERRSLFEQLDIETAAETLGEIDAEMQVAIVGDLDEERAADILEEMAPDEATDLLQDLPEEQREELIQLMSGAEGEDVEELLAYPEDCAGGIMTTDFVALPRELAAGAAIDRLRELRPETEMAYYLYVVDAEGRLDGVVSLRDLVVAPPETQLAAIMNPHVLRVDARADKEEVASLIAKYDLLALPVVNDDQVLLGAVTIDDVVELILPRRWKKRSLRTIAR